MGRGWIHARLYCGSAGRRTTGPRSSKGLPLACSLSVILPVHNAESTLATLVAQLLDVLPDLTPRFEIFVVDDGSSDQTAEVALELARQYPQLRLMRHTSPRGVEASVKTGMSRATGEIVIVQEDQTSVSASDLARLWQMRLDDQLVIARIHAQPKPIDAGLLDRLSAWGLALKDMAQTRQETSGLHMIRRQAAEDLARRPQPETEVNVTHLPAGAAVQSRSDAHHERTAGRLVPGFLKHLRDLMVKE